MATYLDEYIRALKDKNIKLSFKPEEMPSYAFTYKQLDKHIASICKPAKGYHKE